MTDEPSFIRSFRLVVEFIWRARYFALPFVSGGLSLVLGVLAFRHLGEGYAILLLAIWVGVGFMFQGIISVIAGMVVLAWPFDSIVVLAVVTGAWLVALGICQIVGSLQARKGVSEMDKGVERLAGVAS
jgi:uncharacterized membrane protein HdeD (DUF308 family)